MPGQPAPERPGFAAWPALGMLIQLAVTDPRRLAQARQLLEDDLAALDRTCSRFRPDSEIVAVGNAAGGASRPVTVTVSPLLAEAVAVALRAAELTDGDVDPTVGAALAALGYDRDFAQLTPPAAPSVPATLTPSTPPATRPAPPARPAPPTPEIPATTSTPLTPSDPLGAPRPARSGPVGIRIIPGWRSLSVDVAAGRLTVPAGVRLDLGATVKGWAADRAAARLADQLGCGVLVSLGGDTAVAGPAPDAGWQVRVQDRTGLPDEPADGPVQVVAIRDGGLATSSTAARRWAHGGDVLHHILDPRTGRPAAPVWRTVSVAAATCADANTAATAAIIRGPRAPAWLDSLRLPARLVAQDGTIHTTPGWPAPAPSTP